MAEQSPFSKKWMFLSMIIFIVSELVIGGLVASLIGGSYMSMSLRFMLQGILQITSFFVGGFIIGAISPGIRILEPALAAFLSFLLMLILTLFTPYSFIHFSLTKLLIGGGIALILAMVGARLGEKVTGNKDRSR